jgi:predicted O-methyltransferase YrrM
LPNLHQAIAYVRHWLNEVDDHSIHSPYFFDFYRKVVRGKTDETVFAEIEKLRANLLINPTRITVEDYGAGSAITSGSQRALSDIARTSASPKELAELYARIILFADARRIVELGSCLGLTTLYLARKKGTEVITFEGSPSLINVSLTNFEYFDQQNIRLIEGRIDATLPDFIQDPAKINFVLMDANHRYTATMKYFNVLMRRLNEESIVVVDDIHLSPEMEKAWDELCHHELVYGSVDLFRCGILFFEPGLNRQHFVWSMK